MDAPRIVAGVVVTSLVLSGCVGAPTADANWNIEVRNGSLPADPEVTYGRIKWMLNASVDPPNVIVVVDPSTEPVDEPFRGGFRGEFWEVMEVTRKSGRIVDLEKMEQGYTAATGGITILTGDNESDVLRYVLAHEMVHYVQFRRGEVLKLTGKVDSTTVDGRFAYRAILEGVAVYTTDRYIERYLDVEESNSALYQELRKRMEPGGLARYGNSAYIYGGRYVAGRLDSPRNVHRLYDRPPTTSEQVIHGYLPSEEPMRNLSVDVDANGWTAEGSDRLGEGFLRVALRNGLSRERADRAAAGWGNDTLRTFEPPSFAFDRGYAWVVRWDDPANATEFETGFREYLGARANRTNGTWTDGDTSFSIRRVGPTTTVVLAGPDRFVRETTVGGQSAAVTLSLPDPVERDDTDEDPTADDARRPGGPHPSLAQSVFPTAKRSAGI